MCHCCTDMVRKWPNIATHPILSPFQLSLIPASILFKSRGPNLPSNSWHLRIKSPKDFPSHSVDKNPPANARDTGSVPSLGRLHTPQSTWPMCHSHQVCTLQLTSCNYQTHVPQLLKPVCPKACAPQQEMSLQWRACALLQEYPPLATIRESPCKATKTQDSHK